MKYGYEKAHEIHSRKNCSCNNEYNIHSVSCKTFTDYLKYVQEFDDDVMMDFDNEDEYEFGGTVKMCCCQPSIPHDESIKFVLNGSEEAQNCILFENRREGALMLEADVN